MADDDGFLSRWSRRKVQVKQGVPVPPSPASAAPPAFPALPEAGAAGRVAPKLPAPVVSAPPVTLAPAADATSAANPAEARAHPPPPTLQEAMELTPADDFSRFVGRGVDPQVKNTALKALFSDPHFNVMDGLDTYIDDYNTPDPLPPGMLRKMVQSTMLGLFDDEPDPADKTVPSPALAPATESPSPLAAAPTPLTEPLLPHEDPAVRLQPNDDAGPAGDQPGTVEDTGGQL